MNSYLRNGLSRVSFHTSKGARLYESILTFDIFVFWGFMILCVEGKYIRHLDYRSSRHRVLITNILSKSNCWKQHSWPCSYVFVTGLEQAILRLWPQVDGAGGPWQIPWPVPNSQHCDGLQRGRLSTALYIPESKMNLFSTNNTAEYV